jgi:hypothetical protein
MAYFVSSFPGELWLFLFCWPPSTVDSLVLNADFHFVADGTSGFSLSWPTADVARLIMAV